MLTDDEKIRGMLLFMFLSGFIVSGLGILSVATKGVNLDAGSILFISVMVGFGFLGLISSHRYKKYGIEGLSFGKKQYWRKKYD